MDNISEEERAWWPQFYKDIEEEDKKVETGFTKKVNHVQHDICPCGNHPVSMPCAKGKKKEREE